MWLLLPWEHGCTARLSRFTYCWQCMGPVTGLQECGETSRSIEDIFAADLEKRMDIPHCDIKQSNITHLGLDIVGINQCERNNSRKNINLLQMEAAPKAMNGTGKWRT